jgi:hypothetical protein
MCNSSGTKSPAWVGSLALASYVLFAPPALAASVSVIPAAGTPKNAIFVNHGKGFARVTEAQTGDSVMALGAAPPSSSIPTAAGWK